MAMLLPRVTRKPLWPINRFERFIWARIFIFRNPPLSLYKIPRSVKMGVTKLAKRSTAMTTLQVHFTGHQLDVSEALRNFTQEKLERLQRHFDRIISINVTFIIEKLSHIAE